MKDKQFDVVALGELLIDFTERYVAHGIGCSGRSCREQQYHIEYIQERFRPGTAWQGNLEHGGNVFIQSNCSGLMSLG